MMKTKLVYVLTCSESGTYIEQALMSIWSARHHNPDAHIVLLTDDKTDRLLTGTRGGLLDYVTEKIVVPFVDENASMMYRSRWIKTSARELVEGDFLFIDCDTIVCKSLAEIDGFQCEMGAVGDNNVKFSDDISRNKVCVQVAQLGCDISEEEYYFSSGVLFCKDTTKTRLFYREWHQNWQDGVSTCKVFIDQPSLAKTNIGAGHLIVPLPNTYNCVLYTQDIELGDAVILHLPAYNNTSFLFFGKFLDLIRMKGLQQWMKDIILDVHATYLPFDYHVKHSSLRQSGVWIRELAFAARIYRRNVDKSFGDWSFRVRWESLVRFLLSCGLSRLGVFSWLCMRRLGLRKKNGLKKNVCSIV